MEKDFENLSIDEASDKMRESVEPKKLFIEGHTLNKYFFCLKKGMKFSFWNIESLEEKVSAFKECIKNANLDVIIFYDYDLIDSENVEKWKTRREAELTSGEKVMPTNFSITLGVLFEKNGIKVHYTSTPGNEITIASFAKFHKADVLSQRKDFLKFKNRSFKLYRDFEIRGKEIELKLNNDEEQEKSMEILEILPQTYQVNNNLIECLKKTKVLHLGVPSSLTKQLGNPYKRISPLREALYFNKKLEFPVKEILCEWSSENNEVNWIERKANAKPEFENLLADPFAAFEKFFAAAREKPAELDNEIEWENHLFSCVIITIIICRAAYDKIDLIAELKKAREKLNIKTTKKCLQTNIERGPSYKEHAGFNQELEDFDEEFFKKAEREKKNPKAGREKNNPKAYEKNCSDCKKEFFLTQKEVNFFQEKGFDLPKRCKPCREKKRK